MLEKLDSWIKTFSSDATVAPKDDHLWAETLAGLLIEAAMADGVLDQDERDQHFARADQPAGP